MGGRTFGSDDWNTYNTYTSSAAVKSATSAAEIFSHKFDDSLNPSKFAFRESCNSPANPKSTPVILGLDVTGSMGRIAVQIAKEGLGTLIREIFERKPVSDPHIAFAGIGDVDYDSAPLQFSQFEADIRILDELKKLWVEGNGGGNHWESYNLPWHFAATRVKADALNEGRKGVIITFGDEPPPPDLTIEQLRKVYGDAAPEVALSNSALFNLLTPHWHVFHLIVEQGTHIQYYGMDRVLPKWREIMGQNVVVLSDYTKLPEVCVSLMQVAAGTSKEEVSKSWGSGTDLVVARAIGGLTVPSSTSGGLVRFKDAS